MRARIGVTALLLCGFGPFTCADSNVERAREALKGAEAEAALEHLSAVEDDAPEVHHARAVGHLILQKPDEAKTDLDQAFRRVAEDQAKKPEERPENHDDLRKRVAFAKGLTAVAKEEWDTAQVEFGKVLAIDPEDADARWNLELAWYEANPPCPKREDDHEPDDTRQDAKPYDPEKAKDRLLCPANEDWYSVEAKANTLLFVTVTGELDYTEGDHRQVTLELYGPDRAEPLRQAPVVDGKATVGVNGVPKDSVWHARLHGPGDAEFKYALQVDVVPPCPVDDQKEENDTPDAATPLEDGEHPGMKACPDDPDWFAIKAPAGEKRQVTVQFDPARAMLSATMFGPDGTTPLAVARATKNGLVMNLPEGEDERAVTVRVETAGRQENIYALKVGPPEDNEGQDDQQQPPPEDDEKKDDEKKDEPQDDQQKDQPKDQGDQPKEPPKPDQVDMEQLIEALDKHDKNPQLEKALRELRVVPRMEDY